jgi:hypothetical protein
MPGLDMIKKIIFLFWRVLGVRRIQIEQGKQGRIIADLLEKVEGLKYQQQQNLLVLGNCLKVMSSSPEEVKSSAIYRRCAMILELVCPKKIRDVELARIGKNFDGGYVMVGGFDCEGTDAAYSFGISDDVSWDSGIAALGIDVFMYDHTIDSLPDENSRFHFNEIGVTGHKSGKNLETLPGLLLKNGHGDSDRLILKMDIEGCEWDVFDFCSKQTISQFSQIVVEFHDLTKERYCSSDSKILRVLKKIDETHQCVHVHANGTGTPLWIHDLVLPDLIEVTYVRRSDYGNEFFEDQRSFPTHLDQPTFEGWPEVYLGRLGALEKGAS